MNDESTDCWFCGERIYRMWRTHLNDGTFYGAYCSLECSKYDSWGPKFQDSYPKFIPGWKRSDHVRKISK